MNDPLTLTADQILKARALDIFAVESSAAALFRALAKKWHPDKTGDSKVFTSINMKYQEAQKAWANGGYPNTLKIGQTLYPYLAVRPFELGEVYICPRHIIWASQRQYDDLAKQWLETTKHYNFPNDDVKTKIAPYIPRNSHTKAVGDRAYTIIDRPRDFIRCADILSIKGPFDPKHVAWTCSRAYNLAGFLKYSKLMHLDISPETFFIEPATHLGGLYGGWYYAGHKKAIAAPNRSVHFAKMSNQQAADAQIRIMGRRLLGCNTASQLRLNKDIPNPLKAWLLGSPMDNILEAEDKWKRALEDSYGARKFTELKLTTADIYSAQ